MSGNISSIVYTLLAIFVLIYTSILFVWIKDAVKPDSLSAMLKNIITDKLEQVHPMLDELADKHAVDLADSAVAAIHEQIPTIETALKDMIKEHSGALVNRIKVELFPQFHEVLKQNSKEIKLAAEALSDENATKELAKILVKNISEEMDISEGLIAADMDAELEKIRQHLESLLTKPASELTAKDAAQKEAIVAALYLFSKDQALGKICKTALDRIGYSWEYLLKEFGLEGMAEGELDIEVDVEVK
jgi:hypothetical protein